MEEQITLPHYTFYGIADNAGLDSFVKAELPSNGEVAASKLGILDEIGSNPKLLKINKNFFAMKLRIRFTGERSSEMYTVRLPEQISDIVHKLMQQHKYVEARDMIQQLSTYRKIS